MAAVGAITIDIRASRDAHVDAGDRILASLSNQAIDIFNVKGALVDAFIAAGLVGLGEDHTLGGTGAGADVSGPGSIGAFRISGARTRRA